MDDELDRLLVELPAPDVPAELRRRVLADFDRLAARPSLARALRRLAEAVWPGGPVWQPAAAFALAVLLGFGAAAVAPLESENGDGPNLFAAASDFEG